MDDQNKNVPENQPQESTDVPQPTPDQTAVPPQPVDANEPSAQTPTVSSEQMQSVPQPTQQPTVNEDAVQPVAPAQSEVQSPTTDTPVTQQPVTSQNPVAPATALKNTASQSQAQADVTKAKNKKLLIIILSIVGGLCVIGIALLLYFLVFSGPSKEEYQASYAAASKAAAVLPDGENDVTTLIGSTSAGTYTAIDANLASAKKSITDFDSNDKMLALTKGINGRSVSSDYKNYRSKADAYVAYSTSFIAAYGNFVPVYTDCSKGFQSSSGAFATALNTCVSNLKTVDASMNADVAQYVKGYTDYIQSIMDGYNNYTNYRIDKTTFTAAMEKADSDSAQSARDFKQQTADKFESLAPTKELQAVVTDLQASIK